MSFILVPILVIVCNCMPVFAAEDAADGQAPIADCHGLSATSSYLGGSTITENVGAAFLYEVNSNTLMYAYNPDVKMYPSSLVKIVTALLAIKEGNLNDIVTVKQDVLDSVPYYAASAKLIAGEEISLSDLIYCMMIGSANDAAAVIADHVSHSQVAFVQKMNNFAQELGCTGTHFVNVHGLHHERQYTTARDMARILAEAAKLDTFLKYFCATRYTVPATNKTPDGRALVTNNYLMNNEVLDMYYDPRVIGGRTATTETGLRSLASLAENESMRVLCIVMDSGSTYDEEGNTLVYGSFTETTALLNVGLNGLKVAQILHKDQVLKQSAVENGINDVVLGTASSVYSVLPEDVTISNLTYSFTNETHPINAPVELGQVLAAVQVWYDGQCVGQTELVAMNAVPLYVTPQEPEQNVVQEEETNTSIIVTGSIVVGVIIIAFGIFAGKRLIMILIEKHDNQYRRNRRRDR